MKRHEVDGFRYKRSSASMRRRGVPIHGYVGPNGSGKSLAMVLDTLPSLLQGRRVLSTVHLLDWSIPNVHELHHDLPAGSRAKCNDAAHHPLFEALTDYRQLIDAEHCDVLLDEVTGVASSRESQAMPSEIVNLLVQLRRRDLCLRWSAPAWGRADIVIRETSQAVTVARGYLRQKTYVERQVVTTLDDGTELVDVAREPNLWPSRRVFHWRTYDAQAFDDGQTQAVVHGKDPELKPMARQWFRRGGHLVEVAYDTLASVSNLGRISDAGRCLDCGGKRRAEPCSCAKGSHVQAVEQPLVGVLTGEAGGPRARGMSGPPAPVH